MIQKWNGIQNAKGSGMERNWRLSEAQVGVSLDLICPWRLPFPSHFWIVNSNCELWLVSFRHSFQSASLLLFWLEFLLRLVSCHLRECSRWWGDSWGQMSTRPNLREDENFRGSAGLVSLEMVTALLSWVLDCQQLTAGGLVTLVLDLQRKLETTKWNKIKTK